MTTKKLKLEPIFKQALNKFTKKYISNPKVIGILLSGSHIHSKPDKNSDLDVFIITKNSQMRERGNTFIEGIEIEYFMNPVEQIRDYFSKEASKSKGNPTTAHMFANSVVLLNRSKEVNKLITEGKIIIRQKRPKQNKLELEFLRYHIDNLQKDLENVYLRKDWFAFNTICNQIIEESLESFYKIKRLHKEKSKRLQLDIHRLDSKFEDIYSLAILEKDYSKKYGRINKLIAYVENILGGKRPKEWILKSKCPCCDILCPLKV